MSQENVEIVRRALEVQIGSGAAFDLGLLADDFEWILVPEPFEGKIGLARPRGIGRVPAPLDPGL